MLNYTKLSGDKTIMLCEKGDTKNHLITPKGVTKLKDTFAKWCLKNNILLE